MESLHNLAFALFVRKLMKPTREGKQEDEPYLQFVFHSIMENLAALNFSTRKAV
jgi:hypothetical protein